MLVYLNPTDWLTLINIRHSACLFEPDSEQGSASDKANSRGSVLVWVGGPGLSISNLKLFINQGQGCS